MQLVRSGIVLVGLGLPLSAQEALVMRVADEGARVTGRVSVAPYAGVLPPDAADGGVSIPQMPGWPIVVGGDGTFAPQRGLTFADLDGDGSLEVIVSSTDHRVYAWDFTGAPLPGFPVLLNNDAQSAASVGDLDADGDLEIVQFTRGLTSGGRVYAIDHTGGVLPGFPKSFGNNNLAGSPTLFDLDDDGFLEILVPERSWPTGLMHVIERDGTEWTTGWPQPLDHVPTGSPAVGDLDADDSVEIVYLSYDSIYVWNLDGTILPGWPKQIPNAQFSYQSPALADLDGDGDLEIAVGAHMDAAGTYVYHHDGTLLPGWPRLHGTWSYCPPTVVDFEGDGGFEILAGREGSVSPPSIVFWAWDVLGSVKPGFPYTSSVGGGMGGPITSADVDGDGALELFTDRNVMVGGQGFLLGVDAAGNDLPGFPLRPIGFTYMNGAMIADVDGDGDVELGVVSTHDALVEVNLYDLSGTWHPGSTPWATYHVRDERGGREGSFHRLQVQGTPSIGGALTIYVAEKPGSFAFAALGFGVGHLELAPYGWLHLKLAPPPIALLSGATVPAAGEIAVPFGIPANPAFIGAPFYLQGLTIPATGIGGAFTNLVGLIVQP